MDSPWILELSLGGLPF